MIRIDTGSTVTAALHVDDVLSPNRQNRILAGIPVDSQSNIGNHLICVPLRLYWPIPIDINIRFY